jgi:hypothetical protein
MIEIKSSIQQQIMAALLYNLYQIPNIKTNYSTLLQITETKIRFLEQYNLNP